MTPSPWEFFSIEELSCRCGCEKLFMNADFMEKAVKLRKFYGRPLVVSSAYRCPEHDLKVGTSGSPGSGPHTEGRAIDFAIGWPESDALLECVYKLALFTGKGINQKGENRFIHIDDLEDKPEHPRPGLWSY